MSHNKQDSEKQTPSITKGELSPLLFNNPVNPMNLLDALIDLKASTGSFNVMSFDNVNPEGVLSDNISGTDIIKTERKLKMALTQRDDAGFFEQQVEFDKNLLGKVMMTDSCMFFLEKEGTVYVFCTKQFHHIRQTRPTMRGAFTRYLRRRDGIFSVKPEPVKPEPVKPEPVKPLLSTISNCIIDLEAEIKGLIFELKELTVNHEETRETAIQLVSKHAFLSTLREIYEQAK